MSQLFKKKTKGVKIDLKKEFETIILNGKEMTVRKIINITPTHIVVEHLDGRIEAIPLEQDMKQQIIQILQNKEKEKKEQSGLII